MVRRRNTPRGALYLNHGRWWLKVRPPGAEKPGYFPMVPDGQMYATRNKQVAEVLRRRKILEISSEGTPSLGLVGFGGTHIGLDRSGPEV